MSLRSTRRVSSRVRRPHGPLATTRRRRSETQELRRLASCQRARIWELEVQVLRLQAQLLRQGQTPESASPTPTRSAINARFHSHSIADGETSLQARVNVGPASTAAAQPSQKRMRFDEPGAPTTAALSNKADDAAALPYCSSHAAQAHISEPHVSTPPATPATAGRRHAPASGNASTLSPQGLSTFQAGPDTTAPVADAEQETAAAGHMLAGRLSMQQELAAASQSPKLAREAATVTPLHSTQRKRSRGVLLAGLAQRQGSSGASPPGVLQPRSSQQGSHAANAPSSPLQPPGAQVRDVLRAVDLPSAQSPSKARAAAATEMSSLATLSRKGARNAVEAGAHISATAVRNRAKLNGDDPETTSAVCCTDAPAADATSAEAGCGRCAARVAASPASRAEAELENCEVAVQRRNDAAHRQQSDHLRTIQHASQPAAYSRLRACRPGPVHNLDVADFAEQPWLPQDVGVCEDSADAREREREAWQATQHDVEERMSAKYGEPVWQNGAYYFALPGHQAGARPISLNMNRLHG